MALIDHTNFDTALKVSANPRGSSPDGNIYFDLPNNRIQLITADELATVDFGAGPVANPFNKADGITQRALYNFENQQRRINETQRRYKRGISGQYKPSGAYPYINGVKLADGDRAKIRGSGFIEYADAGAGNTVIDRVYHGVNSLVEIQAGTVSYRALVADTDEATLQAANWQDFSRTGPIDEVVQVFGSTANGDTGAGDFDDRTSILVVRVRSWGYNPGETTSVATGISEFDGFSAGYGVGESLNTQNSYDLADVYGGAAVAPWTGMSLERLASPQVVSGFNQADGNFRWILRNTAGGTAQECAAYLDAVSLQNSDIDTGTGTYNGRNGRIWYVRNPEGKIVTSSQSGEGLLIDGLSTAEQQNVIQTDDAGDQKTYPFFPSIEIDVGAAAITDALAFYEVFYEDGAAGADFDTASAETVNDAAGNPMRGNVATDAVGTVISKAYDYEGNTQAGLEAGDPKPIVVIVEGDGGVAQALARATITRTSIVPVTCAPDLDTNA